MNTFFLSRFRGGTFFLQKYEKIWNRAKGYHTYNYIFQNNKNIINHKKKNRNLFLYEKRNFYTSNDGKKYTKKFWNHLGFVIIPQETAYIVERLGKYNKTLLADAVFAVTQLAQVPMRSELGKLTLDATFLERDNLNEKLVKAINESAKNWGIKCMRYEIRDIILPVNIKNAMEKQAEAERRKRAEILQSEGERESEINIAIGKKRKSILIAEGQSFAIKAKADATAEAIEIISNKIKKLDSNNAISLLVAEQYIDVFSNICKNNNTVIIPADLNNISSLISQSLSIYNNIQNSKKENNQIHTLPIQKQIHSDMNN
ncbi:hypothetical protein PFHG_00866 [Plasmodium falciparum HB3]|uniref:Band 7 domain-containing protein n=1 Tax=Plasmodium falciparum (isolate HB3) TaxID=137071 RepID=A0A0L7K7M8_PLAFX|nr:hypothetical protein PFHG_00866 [Plasmodium falciparum HB3]